jgi:hypothetical protein
VVNGGRTIWRGPREYVETPADAALVDVSRNRASAAGHDGQELPAAPALVRDRHRAAILRQIGHPEHLSDARVGRSESEGLRGGDENQAARCRNGSAAIQRGGRGHAEGIELSNDLSGTRYAILPVLALRRRARPTGAWPMSLTQISFPVSSQDGGGQVAGARCPAMLTGRY